MKAEARGLRLWMRSRRVRAKMIESNQRTEIFVVSFPKCGRTWHRLLLGFYLTGLLGGDGRMALRLPELLTKARLARISYTHNGTSPDERFPTTSPLFAWPGEWRDRDVVLLMREPADVMSSLYHHVRYRTRMFDGNISAFIRSPLGLERYLVALERWFSHRDKARSFRIMSYEAMHHDPGAALRQLLELTGSPPNDHLIAQAVEQSRFDRMKEYERTDYFSSIILSNPGGMAQAAKVRSGRVGSAQNELTEADIDFISSTVACRNIPLPRDAVASDAQSVEEA